MKWRIQLDLIFDNEEEAKKAFDFLKKRKNLFRTINKGKFNEERSRLSIHKCYHDEDSPRPCEYIEVIESA